MELNNVDLELLKAKGISPETIEEQLKRFETGFPYLKIKSVATIGDGIVRLSEPKLPIALLSGMNFKIRVAK